MSTAFSDYDRWKLSSPDDYYEDEPERICPVTGAYCSGQFCDEYGCAKEAGVWDEEDDL